MDCLLCSEPFDLNVRLPMVLTCQHTFCAQCMENLTEWGRHQCPTCRAPYQSQSMQVNFGMRDMLQALERTTDGDTSRNYFVNGRATSTKSGVSTTVQLPDSERRILFLPGKMGLGFRHTTVADILKDGQAKALGVQLGWGINAVNDEYCKSQDHLTDLLAAARSRPYFVTFNTIAPQCRISFSTGTMGVNLRSRVVVDVRGDGQAAAFGVQRGWGIHSVNGSIPTCQDELTALLEGARSQPYVVVFDMDRWKSYRVLGILWWCKYVDPRIDRIIEHLEQQAQLNECGNAEQEEVRVVSYLSGLPEGVPVEID